MAVSKEALITSYIFTFSILLMVMTNVCQYFYNHPPDRPTWWGRWGPFVLMVCSTVLLLVSPLKNMLVNICMQSFRENGFDSTIEWVLDRMYVPALGEKPLRAYTGFAYVFMIWGTAMQVDFGSKLRASFIRAGKAKAAL